MEENYHQQQQQQQQHQQQQHQGEGYNSHHQRQPGHYHRHHQHQQQQQHQPDLSGTSSSSSSLATATDSYYWSVGTESVGVRMHFPSAWNLETGDHECCWKTAKKIWKSGFCYNKRTTDDVKKRNKSCQRFYVTAWTLGLALTMASTVYSFSQQDKTNKVSRLCLWLSIVISCVTGLTHIYAITKKSLCSRKSWIVSRFASSIVGVSTVACLVAVGTFSVVDAHGLFMLCGFLSVMFYVASACALSKRLYWECKREFASADYAYPPVSRDGGTERRRRRRRRSENDNNYNILDRPHTPGTNLHDTVDSSVTPSDDVFIVYNEHDGRVFEMLRADDHGFRSIVEPNGRFNIASSYFNYGFQFDSTNNNNDNSINNNNNNNNNNYTVLNRNNMSGIGLPILSIPSYDDAVASTGDQLASTQPPKYSEFDKNASSSSPSREPELPTAANPCTSNILTPPPSQDQFVHQQQDFPAERPPEYTESCFEQEVTSGCVASTTEPQGTNSSNNNNIFSHNEELSVDCSVEQHCESHRHDNRDIS